MSNDTQFIPLTCPNCGGQLMISEKQEKAICSYCGNPFLISKNTNLPYGNVENFLKLAKAAQELSKFDEASSYYDKALELDPDNYLAWYGKAISRGWSSTIEDYFIGEAIAYFNKAIEYSPEAEKPVIEQNAAIEVAIMCGSFSQSLWHYYIKYLDALDKVEKRNIRSYSDEIIDVHSHYKTYMFGNVCAFDRVIDKIIDKPKIQAALSNVLLGLTTMKKIVPIHYREEGFFSTKYVPDRFLKLDAEMATFVESHYEKYAKLLKSLDSN